MHQKITCVLAKYVEGRTTPIIVSEGAPDYVMTVFHEEINTVPLLERALYKKGMIGIPRINKHCILYAVLDPETDLGVPYRLVEYKETCGKKEINLFNIPVLSKISASSQNYREKPLF